MQMSQYRESEAHTKGVGLTRRAASRIRKAIIAGRFPAGSQLPTFEALTDEHSLSRATMQLAIRQLKDEGFVRSVQRSGLFVSATPPHLFRFGLAFPCSPGGEGWNRFLGALLAESAVVAGQQQGVELVPYFGLQAGVPNPAMESLLGDVATQRLAGVIVTRGTGFICELEEIRSRKMPCVAMNHLEAETCGAPVVNTDDPLFMAKALDWLAECGRKRVAVITMRPTLGVTPEMCARHGLATRQQWLCPVGQNYYGQVGAVVRLLLDYPRGERPDGLVIATDNLVEEALGAIHGTGIVIGEDIDVVAHCNWPWPVESPLPIARIGFHSHQFLAACLEAIRLQRRGEEPAPITMIPALFESELS